MKLPKHPYRYIVVAIVAIALAGQWSLLTLWLGEEPQRLRGTVIAVSVLVMVVLLVLGAALFRLLGGARSSERELARMATSDPVTGVLNRRAFMSLAAQEFTRTRRYDRPLSVLRIDIDGFRHVIDTHGQAAAESVLQAFAVAWQTALRTTDTIGRIGGDEFTVLLPETGQVQACELAERVREACERLAFQFLPRGGRITVSVGVGSVWMGDSGIEHALERADQALHRAKQAGRDRVEAASL